MEDHTSNRSLPPITCTPTHAVSHTHPAFPLFRPLHPSASITTTPTRTVLPSTLHPSTTMAFSSAKLLLALALCLCLTLSVNAASSPLLERLASQTAHRVRTQAVAPSAAAATAAPAVAPTPSLSSASSVAATLSLLPGYAAPAARSLSNGVKSLRSMQSQSLAQRMPSAMQMSTAELSTGAIVGIVIGAVVFLLLVSALCFHRRHIYYSNNGGGGSTTVITGGGAPMQGGTTVVRS